MRFGEATAIADQSATGTCSRSPSAVAWAGSGASGYNWRAWVEADIGRYKRLIDDALRSRTDGRQTTEVTMDTSWGHATPV
jgi:hypothetical protein